jgi:hypothetical protein
LAESLKAWLPFVRSTAIDRYQVKDGEIRNYAEVLRIPRRFAPESGHSAVPAGPGKTQNDPSRVH